jgi:hypothetical protein
MPAAPVDAASTDRWMPVPRTATAMQAWTLVESRQLLSTANACTTPPACHCCSMPAAREGTGRRRSSANIARLLARHGVEHVTIGLAGEPPDEPAGSAYRKAVPLGTG